MCGMCEIFGGGEHWANAALPFATSTGRQQRYMHINVANRILKPLRLELRDFEGRSYTLSSPTGATELVPNFAVVWKTAEKMLGRELDPLTLFTQDGDFQL
jgi:hypothetical protein